MGITRRKFLAGLTAAGAAAVIPAKSAHAASSDDQYAMLIDLTKCDGCKDKDMPACVSACRTVNKDKFPEPDKKMLKNYWPQPYHEDFSDKRDVDTRLTPYNWLFVQRIKVEHDGKEVEVSMPRRCMHCDNPPCAKLCPFGVNKKTKAGPVYIDKSLCFGGAKCRQVCPWNVPQRQAGVGVYTMLDPIPVGGGVMFKCDMCRDRLADGKLPACSESCPKDAVKFGKKKDVYAMADSLKKEYNGYLYGKEEHGGTLTVYVSKVPFEAMDKALVKQINSIKDENKRKQTMKRLAVPRLHKPENMLERNSGIAKATLIAPVAGIAGAFAAAAFSKGDGDNE